jgi:hypothetical protein
MRRLTVLGCLLLALTACSGVTNTHARGPAGSPSPSSVTFTIPPDAIQVPAPAASGLPPASTPGVTNTAVTQANIGSTICAKGWTATVRPPASYTTNLKRRQMAALGLAGPLSVYEMDHRVPLEIAGAPRDERNLWPEPWNGPTGAHAKDAIEDKVHADICSGRLTLAQGQAIFLGNWWKAVV